MLSMFRCNSSMDEKVRLQKMARLRGTMQDKRRQRGYAARTECGKNQLHIMINDGYDYFLSEKDLTEATHQGG